MKKDLPQSLTYYYKNIECLLENWKPKKIYCCLRDTLIKTSIHKPRIWINLDNEPEIDFRDVYIMPFVTFKDSNSRIFQYKFLNNILVNKYWLKKWKLEDDDLCNFCKNESETQMHLFWECEHTKLFWNEFELFCQKYGIDFNILQSKNLILIGTNQKHDILNILIIKAKQYIQLCRDKQIKLNFKGFLEYLKHFAHIEFLVAKNKGTCALTKFLERWDKIINVINM